MEQDDKYKPIIYLTIVLLLFYSSSLFRLIPIYLFNIDLNTCSDLVFNSTRLFANAVTALILFFIYFKDLKIDLKKFKNNFKEIISSSIKYWIVGFIIMMITSMLIGIFSPINTSTNEEGVRSIIYSTPIIAFLMSSILAPFTEEIIFRKAFKDALKNKCLFIITSGVVFGALHVVGTIESLYGLLYIFPYTSLGIAFALAYYKTNNIFSSIFLHFMHNTLVMLLVNFGIGVIL